MNVNNAMVAQEEGDSRTAIRIQADGIKMLISPHFPNFEFFVLGNGWGAPDADIFWLNMQMAHSELKTHL
jgi:hypothetical protein